MYGPMYICHSQTALPYPAMAVDISQQLRRQLPQIERWRWLWLLQSASVRQCKGVSSKNRKCLWTIVRTTSQQLIEYSHLLKKNSCKPMKAGTSREPDAFAKHRIQPATLLGHSAFIITGCRLRWVWLHLTTWKNKNIHGTRNRKLGGPYRIQVF